MLRHGLQPPESRHEGPACRPEKEREKPSSAKCVKQMAYCAPDRPTHVPESLLLCPHLPTLVATTRTSLTRLQAIYYYYSIYYGVAGRTLGETLPTNQPPFVFEKKPGTFPGPAALSGAVSRIRNWTRPSGAKDKSEIVGVFPFCSLQTVGWMTMLQRSATSPRALFRFTSHDLVRRSFFQPAGQPARKHLALGPVKHT